MPDPWAPPPSFDRGDENHDETFRSVGRVLSAWEAVEFELARLFSCFAKDPDGPAIMRYGEPRIFRERMEAMAAASARHFIAHPNQAAEGDFDVLMREAVAASARRNDIAHGIVMQVNDIGHFRNQIPVNLLRREHHALIPPLYLLRKHVDGLPTFAYRSADMETIFIRLYELAEKIKAYRKSHF